MTSICLFGSQARQTADRWSDYDVLVVSDDSTKAPELAREAVVNPSNIMVMTRSQLINASLSGSVFIQHLKQEAKILLDEGKFLEFQLNTFSPHGRYENKSVAAARQIMKLCNTEARNYWHMLCLADILFVLLRNMLILRNASARVYNFDYTNLVKDCAYQFEIDSIYLSCLINLRGMKHDYRARVVDMHDPKIVAQALDASQLIAERHMQEIVSAIGSEPQIYDEYFSMRLTELTLMEVCDPRVLDSIEPDRPGFFEWQAIREPSGYPRPRRVGKIEISAFRNYMHS